MFAVLRHECACNVAPSFVSRFVKQYRLASRIAGSHEMRDGAEHVVSAKA
jgi:hypothetical protein